ncbi:hypothetical protein PM082_020147 [Marasmius tenuissimus]|nr:hypothetical protein PM082_020147 [Marasmius tenuissimus]
MENNWKGLCRRMVQLEHNWLGSGRSFLTFFPRAGTKPDDIKVDEMRGLIVNMTDTEGDDSGLVVSDKNNNVLWSQAWPFMKSPRIEYESGYLIFTNNNEKRTNQAQQFPVSSSVADEGFKKILRCQQRDVPHGHFVPHAAIPQSSRNASFRLHYPTLMIGPTENTVEFYNVPSRALIGTVILDSTVSADEPRPLLDLGNIFSTDFSSHHIVVCGINRGVRVFDRNSGHCVADIPSDRWQYATKVIKLAEYIGEAEVEDVSKFDYDPSREEEHHPQCPYDAIAATQRYNSDGESENGTSSGLEDGYGEASMEMLELAMVEDDSDDDWVTEEEEIDVPVAVIQEIERIFNNIQDPSDEYISGLLKATYGHSLEDVYSSASELRKGYEDQDALNSQRGKMVIPVSTLMEAATSEPSKPRLSLGNGVRLSECGNHIVSLTEYPDYPRPMHSAQLVVIKNFWRALPCDTDTLSREAIQIDFGASDGSFAFDGKKRVLVTNKKGVWIIDVGDFLSSGGTVKVNRVVPFGKDDSCMAVAITEIGIYLDWDPMCIKGWKTWTRDGEVPEGVDFMKVICGVDFAAWG